MAPKKNADGQKLLHWFDDIPRVEFKTPEHATLLAAGYGMTIEDAQEIVAARAKDPNSYSIPELRKAQAMIEAYNARPKVTSTREMWHRPLPAA